jgi:hypothetical protein
MLLLRMFRGDVAGDRLAAFAEYLRALEGMGRPIIRPMRDAQPGVFDLTSQDFPQRSRPAVDLDFGGDGSVSEGEILVEGPHLEVIALRVIPPGSRSGGPSGELPDPGASVRGRLDISYIGPSLDASPIRLAVERARDVLGADMQSHRYTDERFKELKSEGRESPALPSDDELRGADLLKDRAIRTLAIAIKQSGGLLVRDLSRQLQADLRERTDTSHQALRTAGLVNAETVVICSKTQAQTARVESRELLAEMSARGLRCACGKPIAEERVEEALSLTSLGRALLEKSRWLTVLVIQELLAVDVPLSSMLVEQQMGGDEIDCIADISGELVLFELKDKEFSLGSAYSFGAKIGIIRPQHAVIVSTEYVGGDAKDHFRRAGLTPGGRRASGTRGVEHIEGVGQLGAGIRRIASRIYGADGQRVLDQVLPLASLGGASLLRLLGRAREQRDGTDDISEAVAAIDQRAMFFDDDDLPF